MELKTQPFKELEKKAAIAVIFITSSSCVSSLKFSGMLKWWNCGDHVLAFASPSPFFIHNISSSRLVMPFFSLPTTVDQRWLREFILLCPGGPVVAFEVLLCGSLWRPRHPTPWNQTITRVQVGYHLSLSLMAFESYLGRQRSGVAVMHSTWAYARLLTPNPRISLIGISLA